MWHYAGWGWGFGFVWFFFALLFFGFIVRMVFFRRFGCGRWGGWGPPGHGYAYEDHEAVLKRRLAAGEITEEEYQKLREVLRR